jgi:hypothetical protein
MEMISTSFVPSDDYLLHTHVSTRKDGLSPIHYNIDHAVPQSASPRAAQRHVSEPSRRSRATLLNFLQIWE